MRTMPVVATSSVLVASTARAQRMQRMTSTETDGESPYRGAKASESVEDADDVDELRLEGDMLKLGGLSVEIIEKAVGGCWW
jgi:hypothetical protein